MYRRILVPLDGSHFGEHALPVAIALARRSGAALNLATVAIPETPVPSASGGTAMRGDDSRDRGRQRAATYLEEVQDRIRATGFEGALETEVISAGNTAHSLVRHLVELEADLVVMTTHGRGPIQRAWLGSTADGVIRRSPVPVLLIRPQAEETETEREPVDLATEAAPFRSVLIPLDGSRAAEELVERAPPLVAEDATVTLLRVVAPFIPGGSPYLPHVVSAGHDQDAAKDAAREYLEALTDRLAPLATRVETRMQGQAGVAILDFARKEGVDLVAMSTAGRGGVARLLLGSVADKVVRGAPCPVLVFRRAEEA